MGTEQTAELKSNHPEETLLKKTHVKRKIYTTGESERAGLLQGRGGGLIPGGGGPKKAEHNSHMVCFQSMV